MPVGHSPLGKPPGENSKRAWIYELDKEKLVAELVKRQLDVSGTMDEMRKRLSQFIKANSKQTKHAGTSKSAENDGDNGGNENNDNADGKDIEESTEESASSSESSSEDDLPRPIKNQSKTKKLSKGRDADVMDRIRKWSIRYEGGKELIDFLDRVEMLADTYGFSETHILNALPELLKGKALQWWLNNWRTCDTWTAAKNRLKKHFLSSNHRKSLKEEIRNRCQNPSEDTKNYIREMHTLVRQLGKSPERQLSLIYDNLRAEYKLYIRRREVNTIEELEELVDEFDSIKMSENQHQSRLFKNPNEAVRSLVSRPFEPNNVCRRCGKRGHFQSYCRGPFRAFCWVCGKEGTLTKDCHPGNETPVRVEGDNQEPVIDPTSQQTTTAQRVNPFRRPTNQP